MKKILVYGSQEFGKVIKDLVVQCGYEFVGFIDDYFTGDEILGSFSQVVENFSPDVYEIVIGIGYKNLIARWSIYNKVKSVGYRAPVLIHKNAYVRDSNAISNGTIVMAGAIVDIKAKIGELVVLWPGAVVNHDSIIGNNTFLSPNSTVCGYVKVGENCFVGAGSVIVDHLEVSNGSFIKAGSVFYNKKKS